MLPSCRPSGMPCETVLRRQSKCSIQTEQTSTIDVAQNVILKTLQAGLGTDQWAGAQTSTIRLNPARFYYTS